MIDDEPKLMSNIQHAELNLNRSVVLNTLHDHFSRINKHKIRIIPWSVTQESTSEWSSSWSQFVRRSIWSDDEIVNGTYETRSFRRHQILSGETFSWISEVGRLVRVIRPPRNSKITLVSNLGYFAKFFCDVWVIIGSPCQRASNFVDSCSDCEVKKCCYSRSTSAKFTFLSSVVVDYWHSVQNGLNAEISSLQ